jgi:hypothetical protein
MTGEKLSQKRLRTVQREITPNTEQWQEKSKVFLLHIPS